MSDYTPSPTGACSHSRADGADYRAWFVAARALTFTHTAMSLRLAARLALPCPSLVRSLVNRAAQRPVPPPRGTLAAAASQPFSANSGRPAGLSGSIQTPEDFLKAIGRSAETKFTPESWEQLWHTDGAQLRKAGLAVRDRRSVAAFVESYMAGSGGLWLLMCLRPCGSPPRYGIFGTGIFSGAWRSSAKARTPPSLRTPQNLRRRFEGRCSGMCLYVNLALTVYILPDVDRLCKMARGCGLEDSGRLRVVDNRTLIPVIHLP